jgi:hypothetical protein
MGLGQPPKAQQKYVRVRERKMGWPGGAVIEDVPVQQVVQPGYGNIEHAGYFLFAMLSAACAYV